MNGEGEVFGISKDSFEDSIKSALKTYAEWSYGELEFDLDKAAKFQLDPETELMRSRSLVRQIGRFATQLDLFIVPPERDLCGTYFNQNAADIDTEVYLTLASKKLKPETPMAMFTGHLAVLKAFDTGFSEVGHLGQTRIFYDYAIGRGISVPPEATIVRGYRGALDENGFRGKRFGDNCKIANKVPNALQVCGFVRLSPDDMPKGSGLLKALRPTEY